MSKVFSKMISKLNQVDQLIRSKATGQPHELARRLRVAPSTVYEYLAILKTISSASVRYCELRRSYVYDEEGKLYIGCKKNPYAS